MWFWFGVVWGYSQGENARMSSFVGAIAIADLVKSTLGPKGMDKILQSVSGGGHISVTNDGASSVLGTAATAPVRVVFCSIWVLSTRI
jgi:T-complex protein 1 subunit beta